MGLNIVIMAAGRGTRMRSQRPKVLHRLAGRSLLQHVLDATAPLGADRTLIVTGHGAAAVESAVRAPGLRFVRQEPQLGTGHAVQQAVPGLGDEDGVTIVLNGDVPLIRSETLRRLVDAGADERLVLLTVEVDDPHGYGRIVRGPDGRVQSIVEHRDASDEQRGIREVYSGILAAPTHALARWLAALRCDNAQGEYYLTDVVAIAASERAALCTVTTDAAEVMGVNDAAQLAGLERLLQRRQADALLEQGVRLADPARVDVRGRLTCGSDVEIDVGCVFEGEVSLADGVAVGAHCVLRDSVIGAGALILPFSHLEGAHVGDGARVGPYARLRPGAMLGADVHIGNFVEVKNSTLGAGAKANHLAYLGDANVGERVNFGAGAITANYDGANKHQTVIGADAHVGSNCVLVAPVTIGEGSTIGGGSTITRDTPPGQLTVARAKAVSLAGWRRPAKKPKGG